MLDPDAADLVDAVARLCVLRTEDYMLLETVYRRAQEQDHHEVQEKAGQHPLKPRLETVPAVSPLSERETTMRSVGGGAYIRYLTEEVRVREEIRLVEEQKWLDAVRQWAAYFQQRKLIPPQERRLSEEPGGLFHLTVPAIWSFWEHEGEDAFQRVYAAAVREAYELVCSDLESGPFAPLVECKCLYARRDSATDDSITSLTYQAQRVRDLFFSSSKVTLLSGSPSDILASMHPLEADSVPMISERRYRLQASQHVWLVFFFLWCHVVAATVTASGSGANAARREGAEWSFCESTFLNPARDFLTTQRQLLQSLLMNMRDEKVCAV